MRTAGIGRKADAGRLRRSFAWWRARPALSAAVIYAVLSVLFVGQGLLPGRTLSNSDMLWSTAPWRAYAPDAVRWGGANFELADSVAVFHPFFEHTKDVLPSAPLWNANIMGGRPFLADGQSAVLSPFTWPVLFLPFWKSLAVIAILKLFTAAFGTYLLGRALGMRFGGALLAGVIFAFGTFFVVWLAWPLTNVFPLLPWLLLVTDVVARRPGRLPACALAGLVALTFFGGHPETTFHVLFATSAFFAFRVVQAWRASGRSRSAVSGPLLAYVLAIGAGAAIAAATLLPLLEFFVNSGDYARRLDKEPSHALAKYLGALFLFDFWGRPTQVSLIPDLVSNRGFYAGGLTLMLAAAGLILRRTATRVAFAVFGVFALLVVIGADPVFSVVTKLPGFRTAHNGRMVIFVLFVLALLAGWGLDELGRRARGWDRGNVAVACVAALIFVGPVVWVIAAGSADPGQLRSALRVAWGFRDPPGALTGPIGDADALRVVADPIPQSTIDTVRLSALLQWLVLAGAGLVLILAWLAPRPRRLRRLLPAAALVAVAVLVLAADLFRASMGFNPAIPIDHAEQPITPAIERLQASRPNRFAGLNRIGIAQPLQPDLSMRYGLYDARGYDYPVVDRYDTFWRATAGSPGELVPPTARAEPTAKSLRGLSLLSVTDLLQDPADPPLELAGTRLAYSGRDARIYRNLDALPRTFLVGGQQVVRSEREALAATLAPGFDARELAVTEKPVAGVPTGETAGGRAGTARLERYGDERVTVRAEARRASLLVLTDVAYPGWKATVDGRDADIHTVDYLLRGVAVPAGSHVVEFRYEPLSWRVGWIVSLLALLAVAAVALSARPGRLGRREPSG